MNQKTFPPTFAVKLGQSSHNHHLVHGAMPRILITLMDSWLICYLALTSYLNTKSHPVFLLRRPIQDAPLQSYQDIRHQDQLVDENSYENTSSAPKRRENAQEHGYLQVICMIQERYLVTTARII